MALTQRDSSIANHLQAQRIASNRIQLMLERGAAKRMLVAHRAATILTRDKAPTEFPRGRCSAPSPRVPEQWHGTSPPCRLSTFPCGWFRPDTLATKIGLPCF